MDYTVKKPQNLYDWCAMCACVSTLALHDKTIIVVVAQVVFFVMMLWNNIHEGVFHFNRNVLGAFLRYGLFILICLASFLWSIDTSTWLSINLSVIQCIIVGVSIIQYEQDEIHQQTVITSVLLAGILLCLRLFLSVPIRTWGSERVGTYIGYGNVGVSYVLSSAAIIAYFIGNQKKKWSYYVIASLFFIIAALSGSKKGIIVFAVGVGLILIKTATNTMKMARNILLFAALVWLVRYAVLHIEVLYNAIGVRFISAIGQFTGSTLDKSTRDRTLLLQWGLEAFINRPILGLGIDAFRHYENNLLHYYAHNNYIELLADIGIVGTLIYYYYPFKLIVKKIFIKNQAPEITLGTAILFSLLIGDLSSIAYTQETLQLYMAISIGMLIFRKK